MNAPSASEVEAARFAWEDGLRRLRAGGEEHDAQWRLVQAVHDELRRRLGQDFTIGELVRCYGEAKGWYLELALRAVPEDPDAWEPETVLDGAFGHYQRWASDGRP